MTVYLDVITAIPKTGSGDKALARENFVKRYAYCLDDSEDLRTITVVDPDYGVLPLYVIQQRRLFQYDSSDTTTAHDGTTCLVSADGKRYKIDDFLLPWAVLDKTLTAPPVSPSIGDSYIVAAAATGAWASHDNQIAVFTSRSWLFLTMPVGKPAFNEADGSFYYRNGAGSWTRGAGNLSFAANSVTLSNIIGVTASLTIKVENQTTNTPPGSRVTGGTPAAPLGGTAANANDNDITTTVVTSGLGDLSAAAVASRIIAKIDFGSTKSLTAIEAKQVLCSTGSSGATGMGLYYSTDGTTWTQAGTGFQITTAAADFIRTGSFSARYIALVTDQKAWSTATNTVADLNGYDSTIVASVGTAYIIGPSPYGPWAGDAGKVAICEATNTFTIYTQSIGDQVYDKARANNYRWSGAAWLSAAGVWTGLKLLRTNAAFTPSRVNTSAYSYTQSTAPTSSNILAYDTTTIDYQASNAGNLIRLRYAADITVWGTEDVGSPGSATPCVAALFRDSESNAISWKLMGQSFNSDTSQWNNPDFVDATFEIDAVDASNHTYKFAFVTGHPGSSSVHKIPASITRRRFVIEEAPQ